MRFRLARDRPHHVHGFAVREVDRQLSRVPELVDGFEHIGHTGGGQADFLHELRGRYRAGQTGQGVSVQQAAGAAGAICFWTATVSVFHGNCRPATSPYAFPTA